MFTSSSHAFNHSFIHIITGSSICFHSALQFLSIREIFVLFLILLHSLFILIAYFINFPFVQTCFLHSNCRSLGLFTKMKFYTLDQSNRNLHSLSLNQLAFVSLLLCFSVCVCFLFVWESMISDRLGNDLWHKSSERQFVRSFRGSPSAAAAAQRSSAENGRASRRQASFRRLWWTKAQHRGLGVPPSATLHQPDFQLRFTRSSSINAYIRLPRFLSTIL